MKTHTLLKFLLDAILLDAILLDAIFIDVDDSTQNDNQYAAYTMLATPAPARGRTCVIISCA
jgi:hypothetical protein